MKSRKPKEHATPVNGKGDLHRHLRRVPDELKRYGLAAQDPDDFIVDLLDRHAASVCEAAADQRLEPLDEASIHGLKPFRMAGDGAGEEDGVRPRCTASAYGWHRKSTAPWP